MPTKMLFANRKVEPSSWFCSLERPKTIIVDKGREMIKPPKIGLVFAIQRTSVKRTEVKTKLIKTADIKAPKYESSKYQG